MRKPFELVTYNGWVGQRPEDGVDNLIALARHTGHPHAIAGQELPWLRGTIPGYRRFAAAGLGREARNNVLLLREDLTVRRSGLLIMRHAPWIGPKHGRTLEPRIYPWAEVSLPGEWQRWCLLDVHRITSTHGRNDTQRAAELAQLEAWLRAHRRRHPRRPIVAAGDWNGQPHALARALGADLELRGVDGALTIGARITRTRELARLYGSDNHHPVAHTITPLGSKSLPHKHKRTRSDAP